MSLMNNSLFSYDPGNSFFHKLDPRVKIIGLVVLSTLFFGLNSLLLQSLAFISLIAVIYLSGIRLKKIVRSVSPMFFFIALVFLLQFLFVPEPQNFVADSDVELITSQMTYDPGSISLPYDDGLTVPDDPEAGTAALPDDPSGNFSGDRPDGGSDPAKGPPKHDVTGKTHPMERHIFSWGRPTRLSGAFIWQRPSL